MEIRLKEKNAYKWISHSSVYFTGYFIHKDISYYDLRACAFFENVKSYNEFKSIVKLLNGCFSIIVQKEDQVWLAVDRARSMPIYYSSDLELISDSSKIIREHFKFNSESVDDFRLVEFIATNYVAGNKTVFSTINQLDFCQTAIISDKKIILEYYYCHAPEEIFSKDDDLFYRFTDVAKRAIERLILASQNRPIVISLSGGYDSRFIACMLKVCGAKNVSCYTYGKSKSPDVLQSENVAKALGYRHIFIEYDDSMTQVLFNSQGYWDYTEGYDYSIFLQNFYAFHKLKELNWIDPQSVIITGLCGDMPTGLYIPEKKVFDENYSLDKITEILIKRRFNRIKLKPVVLEKFRLDLLNRISTFPIKKPFDYQTAVDIINAIETGESHSRCFLKMNQVHEYFGHDWLLPFWDNELLGFLYNIPVDLKINQKFYENWLMSNLLNKFGLDTRKKVITYPTSNLRSYLIHLIGSVIAWTFYHTNLPIQRKYDLNNFAFTELKLYNSIKEKQFLNYGRLGLQSLLNYYCTEKYYGNSSLSKIKNSVDL